MTGVFITFEGVDGAGKSTHLSWASQLLAKRGYRLTVTREPGGTDLGEELRRLLLDRKRRIHPETEALLLFAARREHIEQVISPALDRGEVVLCDRFTDATFAYQGSGRGVQDDKLTMLETWVQGTLQPDLTIYFDLPIEIAQQRLGAARQPDRFENEDSRFFDKVRAGYLARAEKYPQRIRVIDAGRSVAEIQKELEILLISTCQKKYFRG